MDTIDELICREMNGDLVPDEAARLGAWRQSSPAREAHYQAMVRVLSLAVAQGSSPIAATPTSVLKIPHLPDTQVVSLYDRRRAMTPKRALVAAVLVAAVGLGAWQLIRTQARQSEFADGEFRASATGNATVTLGDGSVVRLAPNSRLRVVGSTKAREVFLEGRAYFAVAKMPSHPFRVRTDAGMVQVLGTEFDLSAGAAEMQVIVVEGRVEFGVGAKRVQVGAGEISRVRGGTVAAPTAVPDARALIGWVGDFLVFRDVPMRQVVADVARHFGVRVAWRDSTTASQTITGWYVDQPLREVVALVCGAVATHCAVQGDLITIGQ